MMMEHTATQFKQTERLGIHEGLSIEEYHADPAISNSGLAQILRSPAHYIAYRNQEFESTDAQDLGTAAHFAILEPKEFNKRYVVQPVEIKRRAGKVWEDFVAANPGKEILKSEDAKAITQMVDAAYSHPTVSQYLKGGATEQSFFWIDPETGVRCKARPDYWRPDGIWVDLKTCRNAEEREFAKSVANYGYYRQAAFGMEGVGIVTLKPQVGYVTIAIETEAPHGIGVYILDDQAIDFGRIQFRKGLEIYSKCLKTDIWPGYSTETRALSLPAWMK
jgi:hypothetical protein